MLEILSRFVPIFLIMTIGYVLRKIRILNDSIIVGLKKLIVNVALPAVLFLSFSEMEIKLSAILLFAATFVFCLILYWLGILYQKTRICDYPLSPFFFTGFEFGMIGVALFSSIFGMDNLHYILLIGLGHEFFIWFFYAPMLESQEHGKVKFLNIVKSFIKSPIIIAIFAAIFLNLTGIYKSIEGNILVSSIWATLTLLSQLVSPLILLTVGYSLQINHIPWKAGFHLISLRLLSIGILGTVLILFTREFVMEINKTMLYAFITFFLLPPPFIIPVFLGDKFKNENLFYNNLLVLSTIVTLILFMMIMFVLGV